jgi:hypothetical protein
MPAISFNTPTDCVIQGLSSQASNYHGILIGSATNCTINGLTASGSTTVGVFFSSIGLQGRNSLAGVTAYDNGTHGIHFQGTGNRWAASAIECSDNGGDGIRLEQITHISFSGVDVVTNGQDGMYISNSCGYVTVAGINSSTNTGDGIEVVAGAVGCTFTGVTTSGHITIATTGFRENAAGGAANNTLHGHVSLGDTSNRALGAGWNSADLW